MKPYLLQTLKELAMLGAFKSKIEISSIDLAKKLETSQQTASRYLLELDKKEMITRELGVKKQLIQITPNGQQKLQEEFIEYKQIFELTEKIRFEGKVVSGLGEGRYYTEQKEYIEQFAEKLGFIPYPGTLNVEIEHIEKNKLRLLRNYKSITINGFESENRTFGNVHCYKAKINGVEGAIVLPLRSHYSNILEFISKDYLREKLKLKDGDEVKIIIYFNNK